MLLGTSFYEDKRQDISKKASPEPVKRPCRDPLFAHKPIAVETRASQIGHLPHFEYGSRPCHGKTCCSFRRL